MSPFKFATIGELHQQLARGPLRVRRQQVGRLEELIVELEPDRLYPYEFLFFRITRYRPREAPGEAYRGAELLGELQVMLRFLSESVPRDAADAPDRVYSLPEVAAECNVSERTVRRWRARGLPMAAYRFPDGTVRMGVREAVLARFIDRHGELVRSSSRFSRLSPADEEEIARRARRHADSGAALTAAATQIAEEIGRAPETVRMALVRHDREHPERRVFTGRRRRLGREARQRIWSDYARGVPVEELSRAHGRSRSTIYRIVNRERAAGLPESHPPQRHEEAFDEPDADSRILGPEFRELFDRAAALAGSPEEGGAPGAWRRSPLARAEESALFRAYNYARYRAGELQGGLNPRRYVSARVLEEIETLRGTAQNIRELFLRLHAPLAEYAARQHAGEGTEPEALLPAARRLLAQAVDSFDYGGDVRFAAYANIVLLTGFAHADGPAGNG